mgnify:CR=1 FL=1
MIVFLIFTYFIGGILIGHFILHILDKYFENKHG